MYTLQRRVRVLREQLQKKDLQLELLKRKVVLMEDGVRGKCLVQVSYLLLPSIVFNFYKHNLTKIRVKETMPFVVPREHPSKLKRLATS